ncbi:PilZ domain-containing protein [Pararhizobium antarcticum]|uniref:Pilus assembly protein PilZ n=1 Tax=Pararhizobium antarcticum TaxID=1798805 RepID=A0A657LY33_9HYPH|nr:PilZ domain-containing protein [Pararhizobium antarcticum]OJF97354.1 pilus assembly protein PilZ [Rhizobium sp. 58]OJF98047.1 pilus assembly protein PilZ [Pararhizobium antarcticum]
MSQSSILSVVKSEMYTRRYEHFNIGQVGTLMAVRPALGGVTTRTCKMIDISLGGATFSVNTTMGLPQHYYLNIIGTNKRIGCAEVYRKDNRVGVHFIKPIDEKFLHEIVRYEFFTGQALKKH